MGVESQGGNPPSQLSQAERDVLVGLVNDYKTIRQLALERGCSVQAVYKIRARLIKKGYVTKGYQRGFKKIQPTPKFKPHRKGKGVRLHGMEFNCHFVVKSDYYDALRRKKNVLPYDGNTVRLYANSLEVYGDAGRSWFGSDAQRVTADAFRYWNVLFTRLESYLRVQIVKGLNTRVRLVNAHYAEVENEFAEDCVERRLECKVFGTDDGKLWFKIDNSFDLGEAECLHSERGKDDFEGVKSFFNDLRDNRPPLLSELTGLVKGVAENQAVYARNIRSHIRAIELLGEGVLLLTLVATAYKMQNDKKRLEVD